MQPFDLSSEANKGKITDVQFTYKKDGVKHVVKPNENVNVSTQDNLNMTYKLWFQDISDTCKHQHADRVIHHWFVVNGH